MNFLKKIFDHEYKQLESFKKVADQVMALDEEMQKLTDEYQENYGPLTNIDSNSNEWNWINNPWPWERGAY